MNTYKRDEKLSNDTIFTQKLNYSIMYTYIQKAGIIQLNINKRTDKCHKMYIQNNYILALIRVSRREATTQVRGNRGAYYKLEWLYDTFISHRALNNWAYATRAYLMMLAGCIIFADKTFTLVRSEER